MNLRNRLQDSQYAYTILTNVLAYQNFSTNLMFSDNTDGAWRQVDGTFGMLSGIAEMFLQSQSDDVFLLPALPPAFTNGSVSGLRARGGFEVDNMTWANGKLVSATIVSKLRNTCRLRTKLPVDIKLGTNYVDAPMVLPGLYQFSTVAGSNYTVTAGHRGAAGLAPENTLAAFARACELGVDGIELDVLVSADGELVVHHDFRLKPEIARTADGTWISSALPPAVKDLTVAQLKAYDVGRLQPKTSYAGRFPEHAPADGERIPTFNEVIQLFRKSCTPSTRLLVEIKNSPEEPALTPLPEAPPTWW